MPSASVLVLSTDAKMDVNRSEVDSNGFHSGLNMFKTDLNMSYDLLRCLRPI